MIESLLRPISATKLTVWVEQVKQALKSEFGQIIHDGYTSRIVQALKPSNHDSLGLETGGDTAGNRVAANNHQPISAV